jgi:glycosyltransferase involved in cell wall biosynthesis
MSVATGLAALGHEVRALVSPGETSLPRGSVTWVALPPPFGERRLRLLRAGAVRRHAEEFGADVIMERYYNFGGEGILAARRTGALAVLEVNAPVIDAPGSTKQKLDRIALIEPLRRWREWQCHHADLIVTPSTKILPASVLQSRVLQTEWGADTERFHPGAAGPVPFTRRQGHTLAVFVGAFRPWHGAINLVEAIRQLRARGVATIDAVFIGGGPELDRVRRAAGSLDGVSFTGPLPHDVIPACLAVADIGVAPFDLRAYPTLAQEFHWSPLKIFEYMATGLAVVTPRIERLSHVVRDGEEGLLYDPHEQGALASTLERLTDAGLRRWLGAAARLRVVDHFSWASHCQALDRALRAAHDAHPYRH